MGSFHVEVYIETSIKGHTQSGAAGEWLVEFVTGNGIPVTRNGILWREKTTENALTLELLKGALSTLAKPCSIRVITRCGNVTSAVNNHWVNNWERDGWVNAKGKPVRNMELWQQVYALMGKHTLEIAQDEHPYRLLMQNDIREEMDRHHGK